MANIKFENEDNASGLVDLKQTQSKLESQLQDSEQKANAPVAQTAYSSGFAGAFVRELVLSAILPAPVAAIAAVASMALSETMDGRKKKGVGTHKSAKSKFFVQDSPAEMAVKQQRATGVSMMPVKPSEQALVARMTGKSKPAPDAGSIKIAEMSLRGTCTTSATPVVMTGMKANTRTASQLKTAVDPEIRQSLNLVYKAQKGEMSLNRMIEGLGRGDENAEQALRTRSVNELPKFMQPMKFAG